MYAVDSELSKQLVPKASDLYVTSTQHTKDLVSEKKGSNTALGDFVGQPYHTMSEAGTLIVPAPRGLDRPLLQHRPCRPLHRGACVILCRSGVCCSFVRCYQFQGCRIVQIS